jgi:hypothetical protein
MINRKTIIKFLEMLGDKEGCNFRYKIVNKKKEVIWNCDSRSHTKARAILKKLKLSKQEIDEVIRFCELNGGHCDCEILFNAEEALLNKYIK